MAEPNYRNETEKKIIAAALQAYMQFGVSQATARQVADIAGVGKSTIFEYFADMSDLANRAFSLFLLEMAESRASIRETARENPVLALTTYINNTIQLALREPEKLLLLTQYIVEIFVGHRDVQGVQQEYRRKLFPSMQALVDELGGIIARGIETDAMKPPPGLGAAGLTYTVLALIREIQAQAFIQERDELLNTCKAIHETIFQLLGIEGGPYEPVL